MSSIPYPNAQAIFYQQYESVRRDEVVGILLALFLGGFGIHHFYLRRTGLGILYLCFFWSGIPAILGFYRVLLHARSRARVQRHPGRGDCGLTWDRDAWLGPAIQRDGQHSARHAAGNTDRLRSLPAHQSAGSALLLWLRGGVVT